MVTASSSLDDTNYSRHQSLHTLLKILIFLTFDLILLGAAVRALNAGLACPDWPLCFGKVVPDFHTGVWLEFVHRALAGGISVFYFIFLIQVFRKTTKGHVLRTLGMIGLVILGLQVVMGGLTVLKLLQSGIVMLHLALATLFFTVLVIMRKVSQTSDILFRIRTSELSLGYYFPVVMVFSQMMLGAWVASTYSGMACLDFPTCNGQFIPTLHGPIGIQVIHRLGAYFTAFVILYTAWKVWTTSRRARMTLALIGAVSLQITLGILNLKLFIPAWMTVLHSAGALILYRVTLELALVKGNGLYSRGESGW